jgi:hypothetical protein
MGTLVVLSQAKAWVLVLQIFAHFEATFFSYSRAEPSYLLNWERMRRGTPRAVGYSQSLTSEVKKNKNYGVVAFKRKYDI